MPEEQQKPQSVPLAARANNLGIPIAIVIAAALIAGAIYFSGKPVTVGKQVGPTPDAQEAADVVVAPVTEDDHIRGNPNAPVVVVEYSDFECPFCKNFHETMKTIMETYGDKVAWVYRQFPIAQLHPNAERLAQASECVADQGGNTAFWKFADLVFGERGVNEPTNMTRLSEFAEKSGVNKNQFELCLNSGKHSETIQKAVAAAAAAGARGTPYSLLIVGDEQGVINGAQPYATVKQMIDTVLNQAGTGG